MFFLEQFVFVDADLIVCADDRLADEEILPNVRDFSDLFRLSEFRNGDVFGERYGRILADAL